jgi:AcrR family transcriptional regulator
MSRGETTRQAILDHSIDLAARVGLGGLTIGTLADALGMSKSGLFAHFKSKDALQVATLEVAADRFVDFVVRPALKAPRGEPRVRALFERWLGWVAGQPSGCIFAAASFELDDQPGPARELLAETQRDWIETIVQAVRIAKSEKHFSDGVDPDELALVIYGLGFATHQRQRLLGEADAHARALRAFDTVLRCARSSNAVKKSKS